MSLEVQTPALSSAATTDPYIDSFNTEGAGSQLWLHTSPEFSMKRILAAYKVDVHQFATVFRQDESGRHHNRACRALGNPTLSVRVISYTDSVKELCGAYPEQLEVADIAKVFADRKRSFPESMLSVDNTLGIDNALTLLIDEFVVSEFANNEITALTEYPVSQASLARTGVNANGQSIALRAELFIGSVELANGFEELTDADEQHRRFQSDNAIRSIVGKPSVPHDVRLIDALRHGLPSCAGMAMGIDRLLMVLGGYAKVSDVMAFTQTNA